MTTPFMSEIRMFPFDFAPRGWAMCNGQILPINQNAALFSLLGTIYGGNGTTNFALPNMQSRVPMHAGQGPGLTSRSLGELGGTESHALTINEIPSHQHGLAATSAVPLGGPSNALLATPATTKPYRAGATQTFSATLTGGSGSGAPHSNLQPYLTLNFCIALEGIFPARN